MAIVSTLLGNLLATKADKNYITQQQIYWNAKYEANTAKLSQQVNYYEKWQNAFDTAMDGEKECKAGGVVYVSKDQGKVSEAVADAYAHAKVKQYDEELSLELAELDIEYESMKTMYDTLLEEINAQEESEKTATSTAAQDTGLLNAG